MRSNRKIIFGLLLILGAFGFYRVFRMLSGPSTPPSVATGNASVNGDPNVHNVSLPAGAGRVAAARVNIPANSIVTPDMLKMVSNDTTQGYVTDIESQASGFVTRVPLGVGDKPRLPDKYGQGGDFVGHVSEVGIAGLLRPGTRAMVIPVANKPTLHDLVRIGNSVDIIGAYDGQESRTLVQDVRVLGVDLSGNDYPNVNVAMRGPSKADPKQSGVSTTEGGPATANAAPTAAPTTSPNAPRPDPAITLEVTPVQASRLQLALASNATLDYLIRPALPGNRQTEVAPIDGAADNPNGGGLQTVSVTKRQIAPYAESRKAGGGGGTRFVSTGGTNGGRVNIRRVVEGGGFPTPDFPSPSGGTSSGMGGTSGPFNPPAPGPELKPVPTPTQNYVIPIYGDGKILRNETVPLPDPSK